MKIIVEKKKDDRCVRIAKRKYSVWPSAYASGAVVKCRQGKIWKNISEEINNEQLMQEIEKIISEELTIVLQEKKKPDFKKEKESGLHGWFSRQGGKGKGKGWVDCNTCRTDKKTGKKTCKTCGRQEGEKRSKYPACRPKPSDCGSSGKGKEWGKKSESLYNNLKSIILEQIKNFLLEISSSQENIKQAHELTLSAQKDLESKKNAIKAINTDDPKLKQAQKMEINAKQLELDFAKENERKTKQIAAEETVEEEKSNFQKYVTKRGKSWKIRLLTKGKQPAGSAYPTKAPTERSKSAPPGAGGS